MSKYTTGEIAKLCNVSVRTVQYYDERNILIPSELSDGGRRLYSEEDLSRMKIICFLREIGLSINSISRAFAEKDSQDVISVLLEQQDRLLREELSERQRHLELVDEIRRQMKNVQNFSVQSIHDVAHIMKHKSKLKKLRWTMILTGIPVTALQWVSIILWITNGFWYLFPVWAAVALPWGIAVSVYYMKHTAYICPACHDVFQPRFRENFWAYHTPTMRRLTCPKCGRRGLCVEIYAEKEAAK